MRLSGPKAPDDGPLPDDPEDWLPPISGPQNRPKPKQDAVSSPSNVDTNGPDRPSNVDKEPAIQPSPNVDNTTVNVDMRAVMSFSESDAIRGWWMGLKQEDPEIRDALIVLKRAREVLELHPPVPRAPTTARKYDMWVRRLKAEDTEPDKLALRYARKTAYVIRGAFVDDLLSNQLPEALSAGRAAIQDMDPDELLDAARVAEQAMTWLTKYPPDRNGDRLKRAAAGDESARSFYVVARERAVALQGPDLVLAEANPRLSRRTILSRFPDPDPNVSPFAKDWRDVFWESALTTQHADANKAPFAVMSLVPARPQEVEDGILIEVKGKKLAITVLYPAKSHHGKYGLGTRTHTMRIIGRQANWLADYALANGGKVQVEVPRYRQLETAHEISVKAFPGMRPLVAPYDFRQQFAAEIKATASSLLPNDVEAQREYVAMRMGHSSSESPQNYGTKTQSRGGASELDQVTLADPSRKVRMKVTGLLSAFKQGPGRGVGI